MRHTIIFFVLFLMGCNVCFSQIKGDYTELTDTKPHDDEQVWNQLPATPQISWGSTDIRYAKLDVPVLAKANRWKTKAWKGERVNAQAVVWTKIDLSEVRATVSDLTSGASIIPASAIDLSFVRYVMTDELNKDGKGGCSSRPNKADWDSSIVADVLYEPALKIIKANTTQPLWVHVRVPENSKAGIYTGTVTIAGADFANLQLTMEIQVANRTLSPPRDWTIHLDLWQNPYSVARYHQVPLWSEAHFEAMRPVMKILADAGQKVITTTIMQDPWGEQTEDVFGSMVGKTKKIDGTWSYDYTVFDMWVTFMMGMGIDKQINCYTLVPWVLKFDYFDQGTNHIQYVEAQPGDDAYEAYWGTFLKDFAAHLRQKGWFERTTIAMDERKMESMKEAIKVIRRADAAFKITLAGGYYAEIEPELFDYCLPFGHDFPDETKSLRDKAGKYSTYYTCCAEARPNTFTFSPPAEATWIGWHIAEGGYSGYLRWAYNSWVSEPFLDSRFRSWAAGDCYLVYPYGYSSIRMERLIEGFQDFEKIRLLRNEFATKKDEAKLKRLNTAVALFSAENIWNRNATEDVANARKVLNSF